MSPPKRKRKSLPANSDTVLSDLQLDVMRALWTREEASTAEVVAELERRRGLAHTTVATLLTRLEKRGLVSARREGRQLYYRAAVAEGEVHRSMVSGLIASLFRGDAKGLLAHLLREDEIAPGDIEAVRKRLADKEQNDE
jgi:BlaI family transcriptional regulator, penicillinase repressor